MLYSILLVQICCTIQGVYMLCVVCVLTTMVVGANIGMHNTLIGSLSTFTMSNILC